MPQPKRKATIWHRVKVPVAWRPKVGEELIGTYVSTEMRSGQYGDYRVHVIKTSSGKLYYVSGAMATELFAVVELGAKVKVVNAGKAKSKEGNEYKLIELYTEEAIEFKIAEVG